MLFVISLLLGLSFPSASKTSWMRPESFRLIIGMTRPEAMAVLATSGWEIQKGEDPDKVVVEYDGNKAMTLEFQRDRLRAIRFELFALIPEIHAAFAEERAFLREKLGEPRRQVRSNSIVVYDSTLPNVMMVASTDPQSENGRKGIGLLVVRYFDPLAIKR
ncbi:MAG: hypothetical protein ACXV5L_13615 [Thermoanaerobaculia bacterium]